MNENTRNWRMTLCVLSEQQWLCTGPISACLLHDGKLLGLGAARGDATLTMNACRRFVVSIVRDGVTLTKIGVMFDEEPVERAEWVGRGADGFPIQEGKMIEVIGKHLIIRRATSRSSFTTALCPSSGLPQQRAEARCSQTSAASSASAAFTTMHLSSCCLIYSV